MCGVGRAVVLMMLGAALLGAPSGWADDGEPVQETLGAPSAEAGAPAVSASGVAPAMVEGVPIAGGWFFPAESDVVGYAIVDEPGGPPFWASFRQLGGTAVLGQPISRPFLLPDGRL